MCNTMLIWTFIVAFMVHEFEEIIFLVPWVRKNRENILKTAPKFAARLLHSFANLTTEGFAFIVAEEFVLVSAAIIYASLSNDYSFYCALVLAYVLHIIIHIFQGIAIKKYVPAIATGLLTSI